jgi:hypothetical protein
MSEEIRGRGRDFAKWLSSRTDEERAKVHRAQFLHAKAEHEEFVEKYRRGLCYLCNKPLGSFDKGSPCPHWLLKPADFKKSDLPAIAARYGFFQIQSYLRWVANQEDFARNINNLPEEGTGKLFETTIRYKNIEWGFSCAESDYLGHATTLHAKHPHYHFQMRVDGRPFIDYSDFHLLLSEQEIIEIEAARTRPDKVKRGFSFGEGMNEVLSDEAAEHILNTTVSGGPEDEAKAPFKIDTIVMAEEGKTISGDALREIIQEAKEKGVPVASLIHKLPNAQVNIVVSPGPGVVEQAPRLKRRKGVRQ